MTDMWSGVTSICDGIIFWLFPNFPTYFIVHNLCTLQGSSLDNFPPKIIRIGHIALVSHYATNFIISQRNTIQPTLLMVIYKWKVGIAEPLFIIRSMAPHPNGNGPHMTASQLNPSYECGKGMKVKIVKWC